MAYLGEKDRKKGGIKGPTREMGCQRGVLSKTKKGLGKRRKGVIQH